MPTILFVCTGNTCRSSMAEGLARQLWVELGFAKELEATFKSAGVVAFPGMEASANALTAMKEKDIDLGGHAATVISSGLIDKVDLVLTMTMGHKAALLRLKPEAEAKIKTLAEYATGQHKDVVDPFGQDVPAYRRCAREIESMLKLALEKIRAQSKRES